MKFLLLFLVPDDYLKMKEKEKKEKVILIQRYLSSCVSSFTQGNATSTSERKMILVALCGISWSEVLETRGPGPSKPVGSGLIKSVLEHIFEGYPGVVPSYSKFCTTVCTSQSFLACLIYEVNSVRGRDDMT